MEKISNEGVRLRVDKWLWFARFYKTRALAQKKIALGTVRINSIRVMDSAKLLKVGDILTLTLPQSVRVIRVQQLGERRGSAVEAALLYHDLSVDISQEDEESSLLNDQQAKVDAQQNYV